VGIWGNWGCKELRQYLPTKYCTNSASFWKEHMIPFIAKACSQSGFKVSRKGWEKWTEENSVLLSTFLFSRQQKSKNFWLTFKSFLQAACKPWPSKWFATVSPLLLTSDKTHPPINCKQRVEMSFRISVVLGRWRRRLSRWCWKLVLLCRGDWLQVRSRPREQDVPGC
jgi:hypothetical protein